MIARSGRLVVPCARPCSGRRRRRGCSTSGRAPSRPASRPRLVVQLDAPATVPARSVWLVTVTTPTSEGQLVAGRRRAAAERGARPRRRGVGAPRPPVPRDRPLRRAPSRTGRAEPGRGVGVHDRHRSDARRRRVRRPGAGAVAAQGRRPSLRLFAETPADSVVGAQPAQQRRRGRVLFDDVELTAAEVAALGPAGPPARAVAAAVGSRSIASTSSRRRRRSPSVSRSRSSPAPRSCATASASTGPGCAAASSSRATAGPTTSSGAPSRRRPTPVTQPEGFVGELRTYQAEALAWIGFLDAAELGGCLALDMGLGKTPTVLAHLAAHRRGRRAPRSSSPRPRSSATGRPRRRGSRPGCASSSTTARRGRRPTSWQAEIAGADVVITTYATAVRDIDALADVTWGRIVLDEAQAIKNPASETAQQLRRIPARTRLALTGTPIENGLGDLWSILDFTNPGLVGSRPAFIAQMSGDGEAALRALNGILLFRRTKSEPEVAAELPDKIDELDHCTMTAEQIGLYQAVLDDARRRRRRLREPRRDEAGRDPRRDHRAQADLQPPGRVPRRRPAARRPLRASSPASRRSSSPCSPPASGSSCSPTSRRGAAASPSTSPRSPASRSRATTAASPVAPATASSPSSRTGTGPGALVLSLKAGGTGLNLTAANHVVLYDRWWNPAVEDQARDRAWRIGQQRTVISHRLVCPGTVDERVEEVVAGKRHIANVVLPQVELDRRPRHRPAAPRARAAARRAAREDDA